MLRSSILYRGGGEGRSAMARYFPSKYKSGLPSRASPAIRISSAPQCSALPARRRRDNSRLARRPTGRLASPMRRYPPGRGRRSAGSSRAEPSRCSTSRPGYSKGIAGPYAVVEFRSLVHRHKHQRRVERQGRYRTGRHAVQLLADSRGYHRHAGGKLAHDAPLDQGIECQRWLLCS